MAESMQEILNPGSKSRHTDFPSAPVGWSPQVSEETAWAQSVVVNADYWEAIAALQAYYASHERVNMRELHDALDERFHNRGGMTYLYQLFPGGPVAQGSRLAGYEPPRGASDPSFGSVQ